MKKIFLILLGLTMLSCSPNVNIVETQKVVSKEQAIKEGSRKIGEDLKKQNYLTLIGLTQIFCFFKRCVIFA